VTVRGSDAASCAARVAGRDVGDEIFVVGTDPIEMTVTCGDAATTVRGGVRKTDGAVDPEAAVVAFSVDPTHWRGPTLRPARLKQVMSDASGVFTLANLPPGDYFVAAIPVESSVLWQDPRFLQVLARSATRVSLTPGESRTLDLRTIQVR
jgi:hypothetical protein